jgi:hypothetical protein
MERQALAVQRDLEQRVDAPRHQTRAHERDERVHTIDD